MAVRTRTIEGVTYTLLKEQRSGTCIYRGDGAILRLGPLEAIERFVRAHEIFARAGVPISRILSTGTIEDRSYAIETSLGEERFIELFERDTATGGHVSDAHFDMFVELMMTYLEAQIASPQVPRDLRDLEDVARIALLYEELSAYVERIRERTKAHFDALAGYPFRFVHGDLNAANMFPRGIIDFEDAGTGPVGYDAVSAIETHEWFPLRGDFEFLGKYRFTDEQKRTYYARCDELYERHGLPRVSEVRELVLFFRAAWLSVDMGEWPKLQKYRHDLFISRYLS